MISSYRPVARLACSPAAAGSKVAAQEDQALAAVCDESLPPLAATNSSGLFHHSG
jgi:hypothetical protein